ncbi:MAG: Holliday junction branch migration protein RuvA [Candidatus Aminicenantes bacterium]|nr:Holliday junction branch migration protein RuvA [Candidatus Aminicenantes bacterium]
MISAIKGTIFAISPGELHVDTGGGFIVKVLYPVSAYSRIKNESSVLLHTVLKIKDEEMILYGFADKKEKLFFEKLISVAGVGGKTALSLVSAFSAAELVEAVDGGDVGKLSSIPGIGKKTAGRIILELTGKLELAEEEAHETVKVKEDLISGLVNLGYAGKGVREHVNKITKENPDVVSFEELFKLALKKIAK